MSDLSKLSTAELCERLEEHAWGFDNEDGDPDMSADIREAATRLDALRWRPASEQEPDNCRHVEIVVDGVLCEGMYVRRFEYSCEGIEIDDQDWHEEEKREYLLPGWWARTLVDPYTGFDFWLVHLSPDREPKRWRELPEWQEGNRD